MSKQGKAERQGTAYLYNLWIKEGHGKALSLADETMKAAKACPDQESPYAKILRQYYTIQMKVAQVFGWELTNLDVETRGDQEKIRVIELAFHIDPYAPDWSKIDPKYLWHAYDARGEGNPWETMPRPSHGQDFESGFAFGGEMGPSTGFIKWPESAPYNEWMNTLRRRPVSDEDLPDVLWGGKRG